MNIGLIAHDSKKKLMQNFCIAYKGILTKHNLYATGTTGKLIEEVTNLSVHKFLPGHLGGEQQMGAQIENNDIDLVVVGPEDHLNEGIVDRFEAAGISIFGPNQACAQFESSKD